MINSLYIIWNPEGGFELGPITIRFYSLMFVIAFGLGWYIMKGIFTREGLSMEKLDNIFVYTVIATLIGARLGHVFFYDWAYYKNHLIEILLPIRENAQEKLFGLIKGYEFTGFTGLASHGAAIVIIIAMYIMHRKKVIDKPLLWILDRVVIPVSSGAIFVRLGNLFNSEIVGKETTSSFGFKFIRDKFNPREAFEKTGISDSNEAYKAIENNPDFATVLAEVTPKHPAQLYEAICYVFVFAILFFMYWKTEARTKQGLIFGTFLVLLWTVRFFVEIVKESQGGFGDDTIFSTGQWLSLPFIVIGLFFILRAKKTA